MLHIYQLTEFSHLLDERKKTERGNSPKHVGLGSSVLPLENTIFHKSASSLEILITVEFKNGY